MPHPRPLASQRSSASRPVDHHDDELRTELERLRQENAEHKLKLAAQNEMLVDLSLKVSKECVTVYALLEFSKAVFSAQDASELQNCTFNLLDRTFGLRHICLFARGQEDQLVVRATTIPALMPWRGQTPPILPAFARDAFSGAEARVVQNLTSPPDEFCERFLPEMRTAVVAPATVRGRLRGLIAAFESTPGAFTDHHVHVLSSVAISLAIAAENCDLHEYLQQQAVTDELTGLTNRRVLNQRLSEEILRSSCHGSALSVLMIDIDHFKLVNDTFGHQMGDRVLKSLSALLVAQLRKHDICARYGGEEFVAILPGVGTDEARSVAERIRAAVEQMSVSLGDNGPRTHVTVSIGISTRRSASPTCEDLIDNADRAMYQAKVLGRNRVYVD
ncbi:MAG: sensor domain-containing diguanylate cyclase [Chloroflexota bacterium]|nr:MAG: sensor domain-containing diguanylate cyclase [Chloroflexota bacterium]